MTARQFEALKILHKTTYDNPIRAREFAKKFWPDHNMHVKVLNTGNGACSGKAAWLSAGSYLAKLRKLGWVSGLTKYDGGYRITQKGINAFIEEQS